MSQTSRTTGPAGTTRQPPAGTGRVGEFEEMYRANAGSISAFFARRTHDPHAVADLTADTFVEAITSFHTFDPARGSERAWLFGIARRVHLRHCERAGNDRTAARQLAGRRELDPDEVGDLVRRIDAERPGRELMRRWALLPPTDRLAVELVDIVGLTPKEAATAVGVSPGALRIRLFRARTKLRRAAREGEDHG